MSGGDSRTSLAPMTDKKQTLTRGQQKHAERERESELQCQESEQFLFNVKIKMLSTFARFDATGQNPAHSGVACHCVCNYTVTG